jgi:hypothetical protein
MTRPRSRSAAVLITLLGFVGVFAIAYSGAGSDSQLANATRILLATLTAFVTGVAIVRRDLPGLFIAAGLGAWSVDTFYPHRVLAFGGTVLFLGGFFLISRKYRSTTPQATRV